MEDCAHRGTKVFGALMASTATTVAIFIPVMFLEDVEGQLFADLALTIAIAVCMSLVVAVTVLPVVPLNLNGNMPADNLQRACSDNTLLYYYQVRRFAALY